MSVQTTPDFVDFEIPDGGGAGDQGPDEPGWHDATLVNIRQPKPSTLANDKGENPLTSIFEYRHDGGDWDGYVKFVFVNVEGRGERSKLHKIHMAMFGVPIPDGPLKARDLLGGKLRLNYAPTEGDPNKMRVSDFAPRARPRPQRQAAPVVKAPAPDDLDLSGLDEAPF